VSGEVYHTPDGREIIVTKVTGYPRPESIMYKAAFAAIPDGPAYLDAYSALAVKALLEFDEWASWYMFQRTLP
jgi:hypothetical protein